MFLQVFKKINGGVDSFLIKNW